MNRLLNRLACLFLLASCATAPVSQLPTAPPQPIPRFTATAIPVPSLEITFTSLPPSPTAAPIPCDPSTADFCITDGHFILQRPIQPPANDSVDRIYPYASTANGTRDPHHGVEFENKFGTPILAAASGVIVFASPDNKAIYSPWADYYGNLIVIKHENELFTLYAHLSKIIVSEGDEVTMGEKIGEVGQSGVAIGSHLHFEVRLGEVEDYFSTENPELWLIPSQPSFGAIELSVVNEKPKFQRAKITVQYYSASNQPVDVYYLDTYDPQMTTGEENAATNDLPAGRYRVTLIYNGHLYERWVEVQSGKLTQVVIVVR